MFNPALPKNICRHPDGWLVRVQRGGVLYQAFVPHGYQVIKPAGSSGSRPENIQPDNMQPALRRAIALRDRFLRLAGPLPSRRAPRTRARSNTGVVGVSETAHWRAHRCYPCFIVSWSEPRPGPGKGRHRTRRIYIRPGQREQAFTRACALRAAAIGRAIGSAIGDRTSAIAKSEVSHV